MHHNYGVKTAFKDLRFDESARQWGELHFTPLELKILVHSYSVFEHIIRKKWNSVATDQERVTPWENIAPSINA